MAKRPKITTKTAQVEVFARAAREILPPEHVPLEDEDLPFWDSVIAEFARSEWSNHQLELAAILARTMRDIVDEQEALRDEGSVVKSERGTPVVNPRKVLIGMHAQTIFSMRRSLQLHARAQNGPARDAGKRRGIAKGYEADNPLEDDLIAKREMN